MDGYSTANCNFGALAGDEHMYFCSAIVNPKLDYVLYPRDCNFLLKSNDFSVAHTFLELFFRISFRSKKIFFFRITPVF